FACVSPISTLFPYTTLFRSNCPRGGFCKHLVALLLTWLHLPERFVVRSWLMGRLSEKNHAELLALLEQLVQRQPDIEPLIELLIDRKSTRLNSSHQII